jgi:riboflavin transporter FmnP
MNNLLLRKIILIGTFCALSFVIGMIEIPWNFGLIPSLKLDLSDLVLIICLVVLGYKSSLLCLFIRNILNILFFRLSSQFGVVGGLYEEFIAFFASISYLTVLFFLFKLFKYKNLKPTNTIKIVSIILISSVTLSIWMTAFNFFFSTPLYISAFIIPQFTGVKVPIYIDPFQFINNQAVKDTFKMFSIDNLNVSTYTYFCAFTYLPFNLVKYGILSIVGIYSSFGATKIIQKFILKTPELELNENQTESETVE